MSSPSWKHSINCLTSIRINKFLRKVNARSSWKTFYFYLRFNCLISDHVQLRLLITTDWHDAISRKPASSRSNFDRPLIIKTFAIYMYKLIILFSCGPNKWRNRDVSRQQPLIAETSRSLCRRSDPRCSPIDLFIWKTPWCLCLSAVLHFESLKNAPIKGTLFHH